MAEAETTILIVDDDRDIREMVAGVLQAAGYRVVEAPTGDDAYRLLIADADLRIDVLFTDVVMPGDLDGIDLAAAARDLRPDLRVLYATGYTDPKRITRDTTLHGPLLRKPYRPTELCSAVRLVLGGAS
jgi:DNA-binding NtrC family response regulator